MSLSSRLSQALTSGRRIRWRPESREQILARLLVKRAEAQQAGLHDLEMALRKQIAWSLPVRRGEVEGESPDASALDHRL
jgi:hypothetical protein